jgi:hypothetical protein
LNRPNVIVTPHASWAGQWAIQTLWKQLVGPIENHQAGQPTNDVAA